MQRLVEEMSPDSVDEVLRGLMLREADTWNQASASAAGVGVAAGGGAVSGGRGPGRRVKAEGGAGGGGGGAAQMVCHCTWQGCDYSCSTRGHLVRHVRTHTRSI